jgi:hypothetical protein
MSTKQFSRLTLGSCLFLLVFLLPAIAAGQDIAYEPYHPLKGLRGVYVIGADVQSDVETSFLNKKLLLTDVELHLIKSGVPLLNEQTWLLTEGSPALFLDVSTSENELGLYGYSVRLELQELVTPLSNTDVTTYGTIWSHHKVGIIGDKDVDEIRDVVKEVTGQFIRDYLAANGAR